MTRVPYTESERRAEALIERGEPRQALDLLETLEPSLRVQQLRALAHSRLGDDETGIDLLEPLFQAGQKDAETGGILAGRYKRLGAHDPAMMARAYEVYRETFQATDDTYPGINAAALALQLGIGSRGREEAERILEILAAEEPAIREDDGGALDHWKLATVAEAHLIAGRPGEAREWYWRAVARSPRARGNVAPMRDQARRNLEALGEDPGLLDDVLRVPGVLAFSGHMVDAPDRPAPRFPPELVPTVRKEIDHWLNALVAGYGFSSAARGSDLLFLEALLSRRGEAHVFLPFPPDAFVETSVGPEWEPRFRKLLATPRLSLEILSDTLPPESEQPAAYARCNQAVHEAAVKRARTLGAEPVLLTVWNGEPGDGKGGTADAVRAWRLAGHEVQTIDLSSIDPDRPRYREPGDAATGGAPSGGETGPPRKDGEGAPAPVGTRDVRPRRQPEPEPEGPMDYRARHLLAIGIDAYEHWPVLAGAVNDAEGVVSTLESRYGFKGTILRNGEATRDAIEAAIVDELRQKAEPDDLVVLFFAGHGHTEKLADASNRGYIAPVEASVGRVAGLIEMPQLVNWIDYIRSRHVLYIFDSCFSGLITARSGPERWVRDMLSRKARWAITAGGPDQKVADGGWGGHSVFTGLLLQALEGEAPIQGPGPLSASTLFAYLGRAVPEHAPIPQTPAVGFLTGHEGGDILLKPV